MIKNTSLFFSDFIQYNNSGQVQTFSAMLNPTAVLLCFEEVKMTTETVMAALEPMIILIMEVGLLVVMFLGIKIFIIVLIMKF